MLKTLGNILIMGGALAVFLGLILTLSGKFKWIGTSFLCINNCFILFASFTHPDLSYYLVNIK